MAKNHKKRIKKIKPTIKKMATIPTKKESIVIALGGNALIKKGQSGTDLEQMENLKPVCTQIANLIEKGYRIVLTHGNGPQVGNILIQQEMAEGSAPKMRLDVCGAQSQGQIGYFIQETLQNEIRSRKISGRVITLITRMVVDPADPAFKNPTKPIGPFYSKEKAEKLAKEAGYRIINDANRGWRRVVPSPDPKEILEINELRKLIENNCIVVCCGGGGIPVIFDQNGSLKGTEAVIDKDLAAELLASKLGAEKLVILTDVKKVAINYGKENQQNIDHLTIIEAKRYLGEGQFAHGSMGPKIEAAIRFAQSGKGKKTIIAALDDLEKAIEEKEGTIVSQ